MRSIGPDVADRKAWEWTDIGGEIERWKEPAKAVERFLDRARGVGAIRVWDLGCGIGRHTALLARSGFKVVATDLSLSGVRLTQERLQSERSRAMLCVADMVQAPLPSSRVDAVLAFNVIYHGTRDDVALSVAEIARVLRSGGLALITFQSTRSSKCGSGRPVGRNTFVTVGGHEDGIPHFFAEARDIHEIFSGDFSILELTHHTEQVPDASDDRQNCHWVVCVSRT